MHDLDDLLARSDVVTLHVPETPATKLMFGAAQIARMRPGTHLINASRGSVVDIDALANATDAPLISTATSRVRVAVEPTNEEWIAARYAQRLLGTAAIDPS